MSTIEFNNRLYQFNTLLHAFAYNLTKNVEDAKDGTNFKAWLFTIMKNIFINNYRKRIKANTITDSTDGLFFLNSGSVTISNNAESDMMMQELQGMVDSLDNTIKIPFSMHYHGYKYQEIADHLKLPLGTVKSRIFFARKELKVMVRNSYGKLVFDHEMEEEN
jgi:RNA polymerase sigma-70 factor, ECF subfamily